MHSHSNGKEPSSSGSTEHFSPGSCIYSGASFTSVILESGLKSLFASGKYFSVALIMHNLLSLPAARSIILGHLQSSGRNRINADSANEKFSTCGMQVADALGLLSGKCLLGAPIGRRLRMSSGDSFHLAQCRREGIVDNDNHDRDLYGIIRSVGVGVDAPGTREDLFPGLVVACLLCGQEKTAGVLCFLANLPVLAACSFHLGYELFDALAGSASGKNELTITAPTPAENASSQEELPFHPDIIINTTALRQTLTQLFIPEILSGIVEENSYVRPSLAVLSVQERNLEDFVVALSSGDTRVSNETAVVDDSDGDTDIPDSESHNSTRLGARYLLKIIASLRNVHNAAVVEKLPVGEVVKSLDNEGFVRALLSLRDVNFEKEINENQQE